MAVSTARLSSPPRPPLNGGQPRLSLLAVVLLVSLLAVLPLVALGWNAMASGENQGFNLGAEGSLQVSNTLAMVLGEGLLGGVVGTAIGWLTAVCSFPGRRALRIAQLLPMAFPAYLQAASLIDWGSRQGSHIHGLGWAIALLSLANYTYVFLLSHESFSAAGRRLLEASRSLGVGPWRSFWRVALPLALPAIGAGVALSAMEVVNELGAVRLLGVPSLSAGILDRWQSEGDAPGAALLALAALAIVAVLVAAERQLRRRSRRWTLSATSPQDPLWQLQGWRAALAVVITALPPVLALLIPTLWISSGWESLPSQGWPELAPLALRSLGLALAATGVTLTAALLLAIVRRWSPLRLVQHLSFVAGLGYAVPGSVLALGLLILGGPLLLSPVLLLLWGYGDRFMAVAKQGLDAAFERLPPSVDEAAISLGCSWRGVLRRVHLPLQRGPLLVGGLLVFVDVVKELPLTLSLRPFDFDTLAVRVFQYASDERLGAAMAPALLIMLLGLAASCALIPSLDRR